MSVAYTDITDAVSIATGMESDGKSEMSDTTMGTHDHGRKVFNSRTRQPNIELLELTEDSVKFILKDTDLSMANALRRVMIGDVPTMAIDLVEISANTSVMTDEFLAHRLGLIPLTSGRVHTFKENKDCHCAANCPSCSVVFNINVKNTSDEVMLVTSLHLNAEVEGEFDPEVNPVLEPGQDPILIVKLGKNQEFSARCIAIKGVGKEHAKWIPVAIACFQQDAEVAIDQSIMEHLTPDQKDKFVESCPTKVFDYNRQTGLVSVQRPADCTFCQECVYMATDMKVPDLVVADVRPGKYIFTVESNGALKPEEIVLHALSILKEKLHELSDELTALPETVESYAF